VIAIDDRPCRQIGAANERVKYTPATSAPVTIDRQPYGIAADKSRRANLL